MKKSDDILIANRYKIIKKIATGGMADVYLGHDLELERKVAIKILSSNYANDKNFIARFKREAQTLAKLTDKNIVSIYDWGKFDSLYFICMEYVEGQSLKELIEKKGAINPELSVKYAIQICSALEAAHKNNLIHRDIKSQNIMITNEGLVKVTDFGIAKSLSSDATKTLNIIGTAHYISPEQAQGKILDDKTDIYSLGVVIYEMLTADVPFRGENSIDISLKHIYEMPLKPSKLMNNIPPALEGIVMRCLEKEPSKRYQNIQTLSRDLRNSLDIKLPIANNNSINNNLFLNKFFGRFKSNYYPKKTIASKAKEESGLKYYNILPYFFIAIFLTLFIIFSTGYYSLLNKPVEIIVPPIENISVESAEELLKIYNLTLAVREEVFNSSLPAGYIIKQSPGPKTNLSENSTIEVIVSKGEEEEKYTTVPNIIGLSLEEGLKILEDYNLQQGSILKTYSDIYDKNLILFQNPEFNTEVEPDTQVNLTISLGEKTVTIPNIIGWDYLYASSQLETLGLIVKSTKITSNEHPPGTIIKAYPPVGSVVKLNTLVELIITTTEQLILAPELVQMELIQAQNILEDRNIIYEVRNIETDYPEQKNIVIGQDPEGNTYMSLNSIITLYVGK